MNKKRIILLYGALLICLLTGCGREITNSIEKPESQQSSTTGTNVNTESEDDVKITTISVETSYASETDEVKQLDGYEDLDNGSYILSFDNVNYLASEQIFNELYDYIGMDAIGFILETESISDEELRQFAEANANTSLELLVFAYSAYVSGMQLDDSNSYQLSDSEIKELATEYPADSEENNDESISFSEDAIRMTIDFMNKDLQEDMSDSDFVELLKQSSYYEPCLNYAINHLVNVDMVEEKITSYKIVDMDTDRIITLEDLEQSKAEEDKEDSLKWLKSGGCISNGDNIITIEGNEDVYIVDSFISEDNKEIYVVQNKNCKNLISPSDLDNLGGIVIDEAGNFEFSDAMEIEEDGILIDGVKYVVSNGILIKE